MGGGDLNLKKSWGVHIQSNQKKVWEAEQAAIKERKRADVLRKEREEERAVEELRRIAAENGTSASLLDPKIAWMYQDAKAGPGGVAEETEAYLLGKRRVDTLVLKQDKEKTEAIQEINPMGAAFNARDITAKAALDPMFAIEQSRQKALQEAMNDPLMRRKMIKQIKDKDSKHNDDERRRRHRHKDDDRDRHHRSKRRRFEDNQEEDRRRHRYHSTSRSRSRSPYREVHERRRRGSESSYVASGDTRRREADSSRRRNGHERSLTRTPPRRERDAEHFRRERSPYSNDRRSRRDRDEYAGDNYSSKRNNNHERKPYPSPPDLKQEAEAEAERAAKLAAMSANANDLEDARTKRLAEMEAREAEAKMKEDQYRETRGDRFVDGLRNKADGQALSDRLKRAGGSMSRLESF